MAAPGETADIRIFSPDVLPDPTRPSKRGILLVGLVTLAGIAIAAWIICTTLIAQERQHRQTLLERHLSSTARGQAEVFANWLQTTAELSDRIVESELFRLFATEIDLAGGDVSEIVDPEALTGDEPIPEPSADLPLIDQVPFMDRVLSDFVVSADFVSGYLFVRSGVAYVTSGAAPAASAEQKALANSVFDSGERRIGPARASSGGLVIDMVLPIREAQAEPGHGAVVGAMLFVVPVSGPLAELLAPRSGARSGEALHLLQRSGDELTRIKPGESPPLIALEPSRLSIADDVIPFARRPALASTGAAYSVGISVPGTAWWLLEEIDAVSADAELKRFALAAKIVAGLIVAAAALAFLAFWWWLGGLYDRAMAHQFRTLASRIAAQKQLLDRINGTVADYIGVKSAEGTYLFVNEAFAKAVGRTAEQMVGLDDAALFGQGTADRLMLSDKRVLASGQSEITEERVYLNSALHHLQFSKSPFTDEAGKIAGVVAVARDVTDLVEAQERRERAVRQTVSALVLAVEMRDPYLSGHSHRVAELACEIGHLCGADADEIATLETAANLSQIGKLCVPRALLTKPERLNEIERAEVREHIRHAESLLRGIDFGLPVLATIRQMQERIDGKGYPRGLCGDEISRAAQILGLCDWFCARVAPRAHRSGITVAAALEILERHPERYAPDLVAKLRQVATSIPGEKLVASVAAG